LGQPFPLDTLKNHTTPSELIAAIVNKLGSTSSQAAPGPISQGRPLVFFMPSAEGDAPTYVRFRAALEGRVHFKVIDYPKWREMIDGGAGFDVIVDAAVEQILGACPSASCLLVGYSFGGFVAWEAAHRLTQLGRRVGFVGLIDTRRRRQLQKAQSLL